MARGRKAVDLTGQRFGKLVVLEQAEDYVYITKNGTQRTIKQLLCQCDCGKKVVVQRTNLINGKTMSCGCLRASWEKLYRYVQREIMGYDEKTILSKYMVLRLKGLSSGKHIQNEKGIDERNYSYDTILATYKFCKHDIEKYFNKRTFKDENHRFNTAALIVENKLNDVVLRIKKNKKAEEQIKEMDLSNLSYKGAEYQSSAKKNNPVFEDLW